jgi:hypothetical protein
MFIYIYVYKWFITFNNYLLMWVVRNVYRTCKALWLSDVPWQATEASNKTLLFHANTWQYCKTGCSNSDGAEDSSLLGSQTNQDAYYFSLPAWPQDDLPNNTLVISFFEKYAGSSKNISPARVNIQPPQYTCTCAICSVHLKALTLNPNT